MKLAIQLGFLSVANIGIAFLFQLCVLTHFGPTVETDALFAGMTLPQLVLMVVSGSLMHVLVPLFSGASEAQARKDSWTMLILVTTFFSVIAVFLFVFAPYWVPLIVPGFSAHGQSLTVELTRIQLIGMVFAAINSVQWAAFHARQKFIWAELSPIITGVLAILLLIWTLPHYGVVAAAWISTIRMALQTALLAPGMGRPSRPEFNSPSVRQTWARIKPLLVGTAYYKADPVVDRYLLSTAGSGSLSLYYLAQQIFAAAAQVMNKAITAPLVPILSRLHKSGSAAEFQRAYRRSLLQVFVICVIGLFLFGFTGEQVLRFLVGYKNVDAGDVAQLWWIMLWLSGMFIASSMAQITSSAFYSKGDTVTPVRLSIATFTVYVPCKIVAYHFFGLFGLALATSVYQMGNLLLQALALRNGWGGHMRVNQAALSAHGK
jgi:putative peptidoglycan lipid II flippase